MPNITISLDENLIKAGREYARKQEMSLNALIRKVLEETLQNNRRGWLDDSFRLMDRAQGDSGGNRWTREELYRD